MRNEQEQSSGTVQQTRKLCQPNADILCDAAVRLTDFLSSKLARLLYTLFVANVDNNFGFFSGSFCARERNPYTGRTNERTSKNRNTTF